MKRVIFVGIHNKVGKQPLCSSTLSGKRISAIAEKLPSDYEIVRSNLFDCEYLPSKNERNSHVVKWFEKFDPNLNDCIVLLGNYVKEAFRCTCMAAIVKIHHPAYPKGKDNTQNYINNSIGKIILKICPPTIQRTTLRGCVGCGQQFETANNCKNICPSCLEGIPETVECANCKSRESDPDLYTYPRSEIAIFYDIETIREYECEECVESARHEKHMGKYM